MSKIEKTIEENKTKDEVFSVHCSLCNRSTRHRVMESIDKSVTAYDEDEVWSVDWDDHYQIIQCQGCEAITFRHWSYFSEDDGAVVRLYPMRSENSVNPKPFYNVPNNLRRIYKELVDCFNNGGPTLCAAGLRAIVEGICAQQGIVDGPVEVSTKDGATQVVRKNNLEGKISGLQEKGFLTKSSAHILHEHRYLGNSAVHELARPSDDELKLAIDIVEHVLEQLYELPEKAEELKRAIAKRKA